MFNLKSAPTSREIRDPVLKSQIRLPKVAVIRGWFAEGRPASYALRPTPYVLRSRRVYAHFERLLPEKTNYARVQVSRTYSYEDLVMSQSVNVSNTFDLDLLNGI
ncbi:hypothetical protein EVAR_30874_1 [Eumeta japonica]|uniref:Uncharacterized protein n=1 Tax=Eumeta variegata TaxID=151549 RepID=A0A4C1V4J5_EUMVA|nr:hypothetical protein EVAR_30874_1 [Eumeta japonica]